MTETCKILKLQTNQHRSHNAYRITFSEHFDGAYSQSDVIAVRLAFHRCDVAPTMAKTNQTACRDSGSDPSIIYKTDTSDFGGINWLEVPVG